MTHAEREAATATALVDAAKGYETHLAEGGKMMVTLAGAMSTAVLIAAASTPITRHRSNPSLWRRSALKVPSPADETKCIQGQNFPLPRKKCK